MAKQTIVLSFTLNFAVVRREQARAHTQTHMRYSIYNRILDHTFHSLGAAFFSLLRRGECLVFTFTQRYKTNGNIEYIVEQQQQNTHVV